MRILERGCQGGKWSLLRTERVALADLSYRQAVTAAGTGCMASQSFPGYPGRHMRVRTSWPAAFLPM